MYSLNIVDKVEIKRLVIADMKSSNRIQSLIRRLIKEEMATPVEVTEVRNEIDALVHRLDTMRQQSMTTWDYEMLSEALEHLEEAANSLNTHSGDID